MKTNIFQSVVAESPVHAEDNTVVALNLLILVVPVAENDLKGSGLNE